jgi:4-amino-4-deoxy-L-arabinose transferase-like glycosyltransferase
MDLYKKWIVVLAGMAVAVYIIGAAFIDVMNIDSSHYAEMSREMNETGNYLVVKNRTVDDYLDKPPIIFWLSSFFFSIFGVSSFTFRIPAILASILGAYSVYRFTRLYHDKEAGLTAMLILLTSQVYFLYNHNFLTDTLLVNLTIFSIWQLSAYLKLKQWPYFLGAFTGLALAMMSKGPLGLMVPVAGFTVHFIYKGQWRNFIRWEWIAGAFLILLLLTPMLWGLHRQFGSIGLQFFFWTQSFGRITGQSHWHDQSSPFFFIHTFIWFILPWTVLAIYAFITNLRRIFSSRQRHLVPEVMTTGGFVLSFIALSMSRYKLPQYIFVLIPLAAAFTAPVVIGLIRGASKRVRTWMTGTGFGISAFYWAGITAILIFTFPEGSLPAWILLASGLFLFAYLVFQPRTRKYRMVLPIGVTAIFVNLIINLHFYPNLLYYQTGKRIAEEWKSMDNNEGAKLYYLQYHSPALDFHLRQAPPVINERKLARLSGMRQETWIVTDQSGRTKISDKIIEKELKFEKYPVQALTPAFLNKTTRSEKLSGDYLLKIVNRP